MENGWYTRRNKVGKSSGYTFDAEGICPAGEYTFYAVNVACQMWILGNYRTNEKNELIDIEKGDSFSNPQLYIFLTIRKFP